MSDSLIMSPQRSIQKNLKPVFSTRADNLPLRFHRSQTSTFCYILPLFSERQTPSPIHNNKNTLLLLSNTYPLISTTILTQPTSHTSYYCDLPLSISQTVQPSAMPTFKHKNASQDKALIFPVSCVLSHVSSFFFTLRTTLDIFWEADSRMDEITMLAREVAEVIVRLLIYSYYNRSTTPLLQYF